MNKKIAWLMVFMILMTSALSGCGPAENSATDDLSDASGAVSDSEKATTEESPPIDKTPILSFDFKTDESTQLALAESDDAYLSIMGSPFYISTTFSDRLSNDEYITSRRELIDNILENSHKINDLAPEIEDITNESRNDLLGLFESFIAAEKELPYVYTASNRYSKILFEESVTQAQIDGISYNGYDTLTDGWMAYQYALLSLKRGVQQMDKLEWIIADGANLSHAANAYGDSELINASLQFEIGIMDTDKALSDTLGQLVEAVLAVNDGLERLKKSDEYMSLASMKFMQAQIPELRSAAMELTETETLTGEDIEAIKAFIDLLEGYTYGAELLYLEDSSYELSLNAGEWLDYVAMPDPVWYEQFIPRAYASESQQALAESSAYKNKATATLAQSAPKVEKKTGFFGSLWNATKSVAKGARQAVGAVLDTASATVKSTMDVGFGIAYGLDTDDVLDTINENAQQVEDNFKKGISGSTVLSDSKSMVEALEGIPGSVAKTVLGDNAVTSALDNTSKFITGIGTSFAKGVFDLANAKSTPAEMANATFDVAASFVSFTKVAKYIGKPFVKLGAAAVKSSSALIKGVAESAKKGLTVIAKKGAALLKKAPKLFDAAQKTSIKSSINKLGTSLWNSAKNLGSKVLNIAKEKGSKVAASIKTMTKSAVEKVKTYPLGEKIVNKVNQLADDFVTIAKDKLGTTADEFFANYAENEGWNFVKEVNLMAETIYDSLEERQNRDASYELMEAKKSKELPTASNAKLEEEKQQATSTSEDESATTSDTEGSTEEVNTNDSDSMESTSENTNGDSSDTLAENSADDTEAGMEDAADSDTSSENTEDTAINDSNVNSDETASSGAGGDASQFAGVYTGSAGQIVFYDTESGEMSFPLGAEHSKCTMEILPDGRVSSSIAIFGTEMFDFDASIVTAQPADLNGDTLTFYYIDEEGDKTTVSGTITSTSYSGTIGLYSGKNERIGHVTFSVVR